MKPLFVAAAFVLAAGLVASPLVLADPPGATCGGTASADVKVRIVVSNKTSPGAVKRQAETDANAQMEKAIRKIVENTCVGCTGPFEVAPTYDLAPCLLAVPERIRENYGKFDVAQMCTIKVEWTCGKPLAKIR